MALPSLSRLNIVKYAALAAAALVVMLASNAQAQAPRVETDWTSDSLDLLRHLSQISDAVRMPGPVPPPSSYCASCLAGASGSPYMTTSFSPDVPSIPVRPQEAARYSPQYQPQAPQLPLHFAAVAPRPPAPAAPVPIARPPVPQPQTLPSGAPIVRLPSVPDVAGGRWNGYASQMASRFWQLASGTNINPEAVRRTYAWLSQNWSRVRNQRYVTVLDYSKPSTEQRMFVFDLERGTMDRMPVAHGAPTRMRGRGYSRTMAPAFSDTNGSNLTPVGALLTAAIRPASDCGKPGLCLDLDGQEATNRLSRIRGIVMHGADYATDARSRNGTMGRSEGCPALDPDRSRRVLPAIAGGSLVYSYGNI